MSPIEYLRREGPQEAVRLAQVLGMRLDALYAVLVASEAIGKVRVELEFSHTKIVSRKWAAM